MCCTESEPDDLESDNRRKQFLGFLTNVDIFIIAVHYSLSLFSLSNNPIIILYHFSLRTLLRMRTRVRNSVRLKHQSFLKSINRRQNQSISFSGSNPNLSKDLIPFSLHSLLWLPTRNSRFTLCPASIQVHTLSLCHQYFNTVISKSIV